MNEIPKAGPGSLAGALDEQVAKLKQLKLPSLRALHSARQQTVKVSFDRDRKNQLALKSTNGRPLHPGHQDIAESWIGMLQSVLRPGQLLKLSAKVTPSRKGISTEAAAYFAATILAVSTWPTNCPYPSDADLYAIMKLKLGREGGESVGDVWVEIGATGGSKQTLDALNAFIPQLAQDLGYYWQRCCQKMTPWFEDGGVSEIAILVPMRPAGELFGGTTLAESATVH